MSVLVEEDGKRERGASGGGVVLVMSSSLPILTVKSVRMHGKRSSAYGAGQSFCRRRTSSTMPVVLGAGWPGVLLHEAVGTVWKATSTAVALQYLVDRSGAGGFRTVYRG